MGNIEIVKKLLSTLKSHEISRLEPNGSTALHAASYYGHTEIVQLLIQRCCARAKRNRFNLTAYEEAATPQIQNLLKRPQEINRFESYSNDCEWISDHFDGVWKNLLNPGRLFECSDDNEETIKKRQECVLKWLEEILTDDDHRDMIMAYFQEGFKMNSAEPLLKAYTEESMFYKILNKELAAIPTDQNIIYPELHPALIIARSFFRCAYYARHAENSTKNLFRAVKYSKDEIYKYQEHVGKGPIKTKTFWSTSASKHKAQTLCLEHNVLIVLRARDPSCRRTLDIGRLSAFPNEDEVLIVPLTYMQVVSVKKRKRDKYEINMLYWDW